MSDPWHNSSQPATVDQIWKNFAMGSDDVNHVANCQIIEPLIEKTWGRG